NQDPHNYVWAILGESLQDHNYYSEAAKRLRAWVAEGVLLQEDTPKVLVYRQTYKSPLTGEEKTRTGFYALLKLPDPGDNAVLPHERTFSEHKADRLKLYSEVRGTPEAIFVLYSDPKGELGEMFNDLSPDVTFPDFHGHENDVALVSDPKIMEAIKRIVSPQKLLIADGHHRYETGQNYQAQCKAANPDAEGPQPYDYILVYFAALEDPGVEILPTHRMVKGVSEEEIEKFLKHAGDFFDIEESDEDVSAESIHDKAIEIHQDESDAEVMGFVTRDKIYTLKLRDKEKLQSLLSPDVEDSIRNLPVVWLHRIFFDQLLGVTLEEGAPDRIAYVRTGSEIQAGLSRLGYDVAFILRGTHPDEVKTAAQAGVRMPQKSTDFYPKILSGLAAYLHP
ncbi:MAG: DUF1015 domain-containing protein, partial [Candidatus Omnitrophica bacterium]|nr:DUF1015 domain-containing protein [Candidatus Omnitrophota bacterium]